MYKCACGGKAIFEEINGRHRGYCDSCAHCTGWQLSDASARWRWVRMMWGKQ